LSYLISGSVNKLYDGATDADITAGDSFSPWNICSSETKHCCYCCRRSGMLI